MHPLLNIGIRAAHAAGDVIVRYMDKLTDVSINEKGLHDYVSEVDKRAEAVIIDTIHKFYPDHSILAEESGQQGTGDYVWIIDPLDGTTNFLHGFPQFAVSIALQHNEILEHAIIYDPLRQELFTATRGNGAHLNNRRIRVSERKNLKGALLGTGFPFGESDKLELFIHSFRAIFPMTAGIRRAGSASLDLAYVACGRLDGFWEYGLNKWDIAAGALLIIEAGGIITDIGGSNHFLSNGDVLTGNIYIQKQMLELINDKKNVDYG
jgi:myo-inositol-1(or 4)-monophosphatase